MAMWKEVNERKPTGTIDGVTEVGRHSSSSLLHLPGSEESQVPVYCLVNRESFLKNPLHNPGP